MVQNQHEFYPSRWVNLNRRTRVSFLRRGWVSLNRPGWVSFTDVCNKDSLDTKMNYKIFTGDIIDILRKDEKEK
jgi:hypothetical protein